MLLVLRENHAIDLMRTKEKLCDVISEKIPNFISFKTPEKYFGKTAKCFGDLRLQLKNI